jgi:two-component SAPR family response regulator
MLAGMHALLVEDQSLIALDTEMMLRELGAQAVDSFVSTEAALAWLASAAPDVGVLDINLGASTSFAVADEMSRCGRPFIFTTGYGEGITVPEQYASIQIVQKPYTRDTLARAFLACLGNPLPGSECDD